MAYFKILLAFASVFINLDGNTVFCGKKEKNNVWAVIHTGFDRYPFSYGMEAACYHLYQNLRQNGVPKSQIILMTPDSVAFSNYNPVPGVIVHGTEENPSDTHSPNVYDDVDVDYKTSDLTPQIFYGILKGNTSAVMSVPGSKKVLKSGPRDNVLFFSATLGGYGAILLTNKYAIWANEYIPFLEDLNDQKRFNKMFIFLDASYAAASFDDYLNPKKNIIAHTIGGRFTGTYMGHPNFFVQAYTSTYASDVFLMSIEKLLQSSDGKDDKLNIFDHHLAVRKDYMEPAMEPANLYGALHRVGREKLSAFFGKHLKKDSVSHQAIASASGEPELKKNGWKTMEEAFEESEFVSKTDLETWKTMTTTLISKCIEDTPVTMMDLKQPVGRLSRDKLTSYSKMVEHLRTTCYSEKNQILLFARSNMLAQMFSMGISEDKILNAAKSVC